MNERQSPKMQAQWLTQLHSVGMRHEHWPALGAQLRAHAGLHEHGVFLLSSDATLPYLCWILDGMHMGARLIVHQPAATDEVAQVVSQQVQMDIRAAHQVQETPSFVQDISQHRLDGIVLYVEHPSLALVGNWMEVLADTGLLVVLADSEQTLEAIHRDHAGAYFLSAPNVGGPCLWVTRKGIQHQTRRRGRRRRAHR